MNVNEIIKLIPHRYPFLLVDRVSEIEIGKRAVGLKNVTVNEPFFQGHFPDMPIMPGVLIIEALAQLGAVVILSSEKYRGKIPVFAGIDECRLKKQVIPGDQIILEANLLKIKGNIGKAHVKATVKDELAAEAEILFALVDKIDS